MTENNKIQTPERPTQPEKKPNDVGSVTVEGHVRIFDPKTKETFVEKRA